jgi:hypothetical protein
MHDKHRFTRTGLSVILGGLLTLVAGTAAAAVTCWNFDSLQVGTQYVVGNYLDFPAADIEMKAFKSGGVWLTGGSLRVNASNEAQGSGSQEIWFTNINASVIPDTPAYSATFLYADQGGPVNLGCNGLELEEVQRFSDLDGEWVGGCEITVNSSVDQYGTETGEVIIEPGPGTMISKFGLGGEELLVDDVCFDC